MSLKDMPIEELELLSYTDMTYLLIKENKKPMNTPTIFKEICKLLGYSDEEFSAKIGDYYTSLTIDKRFVLLDSNEWDIRDNHSIDVLIDEEDEDDDVTDNEEDEEQSDNSDDEENIDEVIDDDLEDEEDLEDLAIIDEDEELED